HLPTGVIDNMHSLETPLLAAYVITTFLYTTSFQQQRVLEANTVKEKFEIITTYLTEELAKREFGTQKPTKNQIGLERTQQTNPSLDFQQKKSVVVLGKDSITQKDVTITLRNFDLGGYLIGTRRMGKSTMMENQVMQSIH